ncbi:MAG: dienelactone hydrolase family protein [Pseudohongiellaceae bacterium]
MSLLKNLSVALLLLLPATLQAAEEFITLDDNIEIKVFVFHPEEAGSGPWPLAVLMSGGRGNEYVARAQFWLGRELARRGWTIAVPVSPNRTYFSGEGGRRIPAVIARLQDSPSIKEGRALLVGVSSGGTEAIEVAARHPVTFLGVMAVPGRLRDDTDLSPLAGMPIYLRIGSKDNFKWDKRFNDMVARLEASGALVNAKLVPDARHVFELNWDELESWLNTLK